MSKLLAYLFGHSLSLAAKRLNKVIKPGEYFIIHEEVRKTAASQTHDFDVIIYGIRRMDSGAADTLAGAMKQAIMNYRQP